MQAQSPEEKQLQQIIRLLQLDPEQRTVKMIQNLIKDDNYFPQLTSYLPSQDQEVKIQCLKYMRYEFKSQHTPVFNIDEKGEKFYLILQGTVGVYIRKNKDDSSLYRVKELTTGSGFGELALISNKLRTASIICHSAVHLASLEKSKFNIVLKSIEQSKLQQNLLNLSFIPYFTNWHEGLLKQIFYNSFRQQFHKNELVFSENQEASTVYIILSGEFMLSKSFRISEKDIESNSKLDELKKNFIISESNNNMKNIQLTIMQKNELFGEEDVIENNERRSFSVTCLSLVGEVLMIKQKDFQRIMMQENRTRTLIEKRLLMKNVVRNAQINSIAAQFDKKQQIESQRLSPRKCDTGRYSSQIEQNRQNFEEEYKYYRTNAEKILIRQEEEQRNEQETALKRQQLSQEKLLLSPKTILIKKKVQKDVMIKGFQDQLKLNMVKKFNNLQIERLQNHIPGNMIEHIDKNDSDLLQKMNLKQKHNKDIRLTIEQKQIYQNILKKRQFMEQAQDEYNQRTFTHLVSCTSLENLNKFNNSYYNGPQSTRTNTSNHLGKSQRFSTPEIFIKKQNSPKYAAYFQFDKKTSQTNLSHNKSQLTNSNIIQINSNNMSDTKLQQKNQNRLTQSPSPQDRTSLNNINSTGLISKQQQKHKSDNIILMKKDSFIIKDINKQQRIIESEQNIQTIENTAETPRRKIIKQVPSQKKVNLPLQNSYYNNFTNPYHNVISQIKKKKDFEDKIRGIISSQQSTSQQTQSSIQDIYFDQKAQIKNQL